MIRLACLLATMAMPAFADARQTAKFVGVGKAPGSVVFGPNCNLHGALAAVLADRHGETRVGRGLTEGGVIEVYVSESGTWTALAVRPDGIACITAVGTSWRGQIGDAM